MYKVMIVDDEAAHRKGMIRLLNRMKPSYFLLEARDGNMAELIMRTMEIDIILTDIRMPNKDGLDFLEDLSKENHRAKVIIVSGYGQFSYAKRALSNGAFDFLLKPVDPKELEGTLRKAEESLQADLCRKQNQDQYMDLLLEKMVRSALTQREEEQLEGIIPRNTDGAVFVIKICQEEKMELTKRRQGMKQGLNRLGHSILFPVFEGEAVYAGLVFFHPSLSLKDTILRELEDAIGDILSEEDAEYGISDLHTSLYDKVETAYQQALSALRQSFYGTGKGNVWRAEEEPSGRVLQILVEKEQELVSIICEKDHKAVEEGVQVVFKCLPRENRPDPNRLKELFVLLAVRVMNLLQKRGKITDYQESISSFTQEIMEAAHVDELQKEVESLFLMLNDIARQGTESEDAVRLAVRYLEQHFTEEISLSEVAEKFFFTASYFSIFFKKGTGKTFSQYIKELRMERACALLRDTNKKVSEISEKVGYADSAYFGKVFKKHTGLSPEEFRKRNYRV